MSRPYEMVTLLVVLGTDTRNRVSTRVLEYFYYLIAVHSTTPLWLRIGVIYNVYLELNVNLHSNCHCTTYY